MSSGSLIEPNGAEFSIDPECLPNYDLIVTEDEVPYESFFHERQPKLLTNALTASWPTDGKTFVSMGNVGLFYALKKPPLVPDYLLSVGVEFPTDVWPKQNRSYFVWNYGKPPDLVLEIISSTDGGEADTKRRLYAEIGIPYYVIHDPLNMLGAGVLVAFEARGGEYHPISPDLLPRLGLGLKLWTGHYWGMHAEWLRWCDESGQLLMTSDERAIQERQRAAEAERRADEERQRADEERKWAEFAQTHAEQQRQRADEATLRAERLAAKLQSLGIDPNL